MHRPCWRTRLRTIFAVLVCLTLSPLPQLAQQAAGQRAGEIGALRTSVTRNAATAQVKEELRWNDLLQSDASGRARANLVDGSLLSLGSNTQLRVAEHNGASQQTTLELNYGRLRSRVVKLSQPGAKFEVKTPHAVIGAIGTDFYVFVDALRTQVIVFSGRVVVKQLRRSDQDPSQTVAVEPGTPVGPGQMLEVRASAPPSAPPGAPGPPPTAPPAPPPAPGALPAPERTPPSVQEDAIEATLVDERPPAPTWSLKKKILVIGGIAVAVITPIIVVATGEDRPVCRACSTSTAP